MAARSPRHSGRPLLKTLTVLEVPMRKTEAPSKWQAQIEKRKSRSIGIKEHRRVIAADLRVVLQRLRSKLH
jgi:hypothetical protein